MHKSKMPRKDEPYIILSQKSSATFVVTSYEKTDEPFSVYHASVIMLFQNITEF